MQKLFGNGISWQKMNSITSKAGWGMASISLKNSIIIIYIYKTTSIETNYET